MDLKDKVVIITGAYGGFGSALAEIIASNKGKLVISGRDEEKLNTLATKFGSSDVLVVKTDLTKINECQKLIDSCVNHYGKIDIMINNAGVLEDGMTPELVDRLIDPNLKGLEYCSYYAINQMKKQEEGGILINISSTSGVSFKPKEDEAVYASSKFGVVAYSASLFLAYKDSKIKVVCFCPGGMKTELFRKNPSRLLDDFMDPYAAAKVLINQITMERYGIMVLLRRGLLQYNKDFNFAWQWTSEENIDLSK